MKKLAKYLKPYAAFLLAAVVLLFMQAICDLRLPDYMSDIVNVGIQQNGIQHASPDAISENGMTFMQTFMSEEEKSLVPIIKERSRAPQSAPLQDVHHNYLQDKQSAYQIQI